MKMLYSFTLALAALVALAGTATGDNCSSRGGQASADDGSQKEDTIMKTSAVATGTAAGTLVDVAVAAGSFKTLVAAVQAAGLVDVLKGEGPFTVFAPTDEAFAKLPAGTVEGLLKDKAKLTQVLTYHVVPGKLLAQDVIKLQSARTVQGEAIDIRTDQGVKVDNANVIQTDIAASNGVIHVIDNVILPKGDS